ncbi:MAG: FAD-dependent oxidoreductase [Caldilineaceae bacterium]|nr:FAD-dependent oxidoreductase [Caldilineaceae bacterium]
MHDIAIIGAGPAGLTAAAYGLRSQLDIILIARSMGGKVTYPFRLRDAEVADPVWGADLVYQFEEMVARSDMEMVDANVIEIRRLENGTFEIDLEDGRVVATRTIILNTGSRAKRMYVKGELDYRGRGVSFSAVSHAPFFQGRDVAVVGGGQRAIIAALELLPLANQVYLIAPRLDGLARLPAAKEALEHPRMSVFQGWEIQEVIGDGEMADGKFQPGYVTGLNLVGINGEIRSLPVEGVFVQHELMPHNDIARGLVEMDHYGFIRVNERCETSLPGFFAAGDVTTVHAEQVVIAIGEGGKAGLSAWEYVATHKMAQ